MNRRGLLSSVLVTVMLLLSLTACGGAPAATTTTTTATTSATSAAEEAAPTTEANVQGTDFPEGPVTVIVGHRAGGSTDLVVRALQPFLADALGVNVVVENEEGGGGNAGSARIYTADPDGYTVLVTPFPSTVMGQLAKDGDFDVQRFTFLHKLTGGDFNSIFVAADSPYQTLEDLVTAAKTERLTLSGSGIATNSHLGMVLLQQAAGIEFEYVSFDSGTEAATAVAGGHTICGIGNIVSLKQLQDEGKIRILACFGANRHPNFPDIPTSEEAGYANTAYDVCVGAVAPPDMPQELVDIWDAAITTAMGSPEFQKAATELGTNVTPEQGSAIFKEDVLSIFAATEPVIGMMVEE